MTSFEIQIVFNVTHIFVDQIQITLSRTYYKCAANFKTMIYDLQFKKINYVLLNFFNSMHLYFI